MDLRDAFIGALPEKTAASAREIADLGLLINAWIADGREQWPDVALDAEQFVRYAAQRMTGEGDLRKRLHRLVASDLYIACACALGDSGAVAALTRQIFAGLERVLMARGFPKTTVSETMQTLSERMFTGEPRIAQYRGESKLSAWLRVSATRLAIDLTRKQGREVEIDTDDELHQVQLESDVELAYLKRVYRAEFKRAFEHAMSLLSTRERNVLRHQVIDGLSTERIAKLYDVESRTVRRWLAGAREQLFERTREALARELELDAAACDSIIRLIDSHFDVTLQRLL